MNFKKLGIFMVAAFLVFAGVSFFSPDYLHAQYHFLLGANQYWANDGSFSTPGKIQTIGTSNGLRLAYSEGRYIDMVANDDGELEFDINVSAAGENYSAIQFWVEWSGQDESRKGIINIFAGREDAITSYGGAYELGMQIAVKNEATNGVGGYNLRGIEVKAQNKDGSPSTMGAIEAGYFTVDSQSGGSTTTIMAMHLTYDQSGSVNTDHRGLFVECNSQSTVGINYGIYLSSTSWAITREFGMFIDSNAGSWTNGISFNGTVTNVFDFQGTAGTSGAGYNASFATPGAWVAPDGYIRVDIGGNTQYIYTWTTLPTT